MVKVKVQYGFDNDAPIFVWKHPESNLFQDLLSFVHSQFSNLTHFLIRYKDEDGDLITCVNENDINDALNFAKENNSSLKLYVISADNNNNKSSNNNNNNNNDNDNDNDIDNQKNYTKNENDNENEETNDIHNAEQNTDEFSLHSSGGKNNNDNDNNDANNEKEIQKIFRNIMISSCQEHYNEQHDIALQESNENSSNKIDSEELTLKSKKFFGTLSIIGELYNKKLISDRIIYKGILDSLITNNKPIHPIEIEALCVLFKTSGKALDKDKQDNNNNNNEQEKTVKKYIDDLKKAANECNGRIQNLVQEVEEMRNNNWYSKTKKEKTKKLGEFKEQVHFNNNYNSNKIMDYNNDVDVISSTSDVRISGGVPMSSLPSSSYNIKLQPNIPSNNSKRSHRYNNPSFTVPPTQPSTTTTNSIIATTPKDKSKEINKDSLNVNLSSSFNFTNKDKNINVNISLDDEKKREMTTKSSTPTSITPKTNNNADANNNINNIEEMKRNIIQHINEYLHSYVEEDIIVYLTSYNQINSECDIVVWSQIIIDIFCCKTEKDCYNFIKLLNILVDNSMISNCSKILSNLASQVDDIIVDTPRYLEFVGVLFASFIHHQFIETSLLVEFCKIYEKNTSAEKEKTKRIQLFLKHVIKELMNLKSTKLSELNSLGLRKMFNVEASQQTPEDGEMLQYI